MTPAAAPASRTPPRPGQHLWWAVPFVLLLGLLSPLAMAAAPAFPPLTGRVVDAADILSPQTEQQLAQLSAALEARSSDQLVVATVPSLGGTDIADYGYQLGRHWGIGTGKLSNGVLLLVAPAERQVRIEVGYGLEGTLTDALSSVIIRQAIVPRFKAGDYDGGVLRGATAISEILTGDAAEWQARAAQRPTHEGGGSIALGIIVAIFVLVFIINLTTARRRRGRFGALGGAGGKAVGGALDALPWIIMSGRGGRGGGWGGGFRGGGGSFGGGGASGGW